MDEYILKMEGISKSFPGVRALDNVNFYLEPGTVHALMGENGAGKSTLMKCLFGVYSKDSGSIILDGKGVEFKNAKDALSHGVAMVHQELNQASCLSVNDNMWLGRYPKILNSLPFVDEKQMTKRTKEIFESINLHGISPAEILGNLSISKRQMVEIAKAVSYNAKVLVFDEPTSSLNNEEAEKLFDIIKLLKSRGCGIIYISHKMEEILKISDYITVMRDGKHIATKPADNITTDEIIKLMVGREIQNRYPPRDTTPGEILMEVKNLSAMHNHLKNVSFSLMSGEVLGIGGLDGAGRSELLECLFGLSQKATGEIFINKKRVSINSPTDAIKNKMAFVTEDRRAGGIFKILSVRENTVISSLKSYKKAGLLSASLADKATVKYVKALKVKTSGTKKQIGLLSGGNQQKIIFARWLLTEPDILLLDEPTRGIDVLAKYEIYELINQLVAKGKSVIMVSSELPELMGVSDRILVMSGGRVAGIANKNASAEDIMSLCTKYV